LEGYVKMTVYIVGHKNPDTDSVCAAIALAELITSLGSDAKPAIQGPLNPETAFVLDKFGLETPEIITDATGKELILVDHSDVSQSLDNLEKGILKGIVDHHKLGDITTKEPIEMWVWPVGCTCTVIKGMYDFYNLTIKKSIAGIMTSAILSDTVIFKSSTCTARDKQVAQRLGDFVGIEDLKSFGMELFNKKSDIGGVSPRELILRDYKDFSMNDKRIGIGQLETVDIRMFDNLKKDLKEELQKMKDEGRDAVYLLLTDIMKEGSMMLIASNDTTPVLRAFDETPENDEVWLEYVMSRKKQVVPNFEKAYAGETVIPEKKEETIETAAELAASVTAIVASADERINEGPDSSTISPEEDSEVESEEDTEDSDVSEDYEESEEDDTEEDSQVDEAENSDESEEDSDQTEDEDSEEDVEEPEEDNQEEETDETEDEPHTLMDDINTAVHSHDEELEELETEESDDDDDDADAETETDNDEEYESSDDETDEDDLEEDSDAETEDNEEQPAFDFPATGSEYRIQDTEESDEDDEIETEESDDEEHESTDDEADEDAETDNDEEHESSETDDDEVDYDSERTTDEQKPDEEIDENDSEEEKIDGSVEEQEENNENTSDEETGKESDTVKEPESESDDVKESENESGSEQSESRVQNDRKPDDTDDSEEKSEEKSEEVKVSENAFFNFAKAGTDRANQ
jgi:manganese-dependent inorganic pyrophosphatase